MFWWRVLSLRKLSDRVFAWNINNHLGIHYRVCYMTLPWYCTQINPVKHKISGSQFQCMVQQQLIESACSINQTVWPFWCLKLKTKSPLHNKRLNFKNLKIPTKSTVHATVLKLSPNCSPNTAETLVHLNSLQIMKSITQFFSKPVKLIKPPPTIFAYSAWKCLTVNTTVNIYLQIDK